MKERWIQKAVEKPGSLHRQLEIPTEEKIPLSLLNKILSAEIGGVVKNPTKKGKKRIKVTRLLKSRVNFAKNVRKLGK